MRSAKVLSGIAAHIAGARLTGFDKDKETMPPKGISFD
jgi:hypothetical protein